jgi:glycosyltransferase involved in cell wall biosynthesis
MLNQGISLPQPHSGIIKMDGINNPKLTVVIPYSREHTPKKMLKQAVSSVRVQSLESEILIVNDKNKRGPAWARNKGLEEARTRFVAFLDADDVWKEKKVVKQLEEIKKQDVGLCVEGAERTKEEFIKGISEGSIESVTSSILIDTNIVNTQFRVDMDRYEDHLFLIEAAAEGGVCFCDNLVDIRKHDQGLSAQGNKYISSQSLYKMIKVIKEEIPEAQPYVKNIRKRAEYLEGRHYQREGKHKQAIKCFVQSAKKGPSPRIVAAVLLSVYGYTNQYVRKKI